MFFVPGSAHCAHVVTPSKSEIYKESNEMKAILKEEEEFEKELILCFLSPVRLTVHM